jgi:hypothetical protein
MMENNAWPPKEGISTPTVSASDRVLTITASAQINAPASFVFDILLDTSTYPEWCTFVPKVVIDSQPEGTSNNAILRPGTKFTFHAVMGTPGSKPTPTHLLLSDLSTPSTPSSYISLEGLQAGKFPGYTPDLSTVYRVAWKGDKVDFFAKGLNTERFHEVIVRGEEQCEVRTWEVMGGVLAHTVKWMYGRVLGRKFEDWCGDLRGFGERRWQEDKVAGRR